MSAILKGEPELLKKLQGLKSSVVRKTGRNAVKKGNVILRKSVRDQLNASDDREKAVRKGIATKLKTFARDAVVWGGVAIGVYRNPKKVKKKLFTSKQLSGMARVLEKGDINNAPKPFLRPGLQKSRGEILSKISSEVKQDLRKLQI